MATIQSSSSNGNKTIEIDAGVDFVGLLFYMMWRSSIAKAAAATAAANAAGVTAPAQVAINAQNNQTAQAALTAGEVQAGESAAYNLISSLIG